MWARRRISFRKPAAIQHQTFFTVGFTFGMVRPSDPSRRLRRLMHNSNTDFIVQPSFLLCKCQKKSILYKQGKRKKLHTFMQHKTAYKAKIGEPYKDSPTVPQSIANPNVDDCLQRVSNPLWGNVPNDIIERDSTLQTVPCSRKYKPFSRARKDSGSLPSGKQRMKRRKRTNYLECGYSRIRLLFYPCYLLVAVVQSSCDTTK